jgi:ATP-dependent Clp protease, protease subunit
MVFAHRFVEFLSNIFNRIWEFIKKIFVRNAPPEQQSENNSSQSLGTKRTLKARRKVRPNSIGSNDQSLETYTQMLHQRIIFLGSEIDDDIANSLVAQLLYLESEDPDQDINLYINSSGGSVNGGMAIFDTMTQISPDVCTICTGLAAGMGTLLLAAGAKGKRFSLPDARIALIELTAGYDQDTDIQIQAREMMEFTDIINGILAKNTGQALAKIQADSESNLHLSATEAIQYGLIDRVIEQPEPTRK